MLEVKDLTIEINNNIIIDKLSFNLNVNDKMAIIGEEGNGKSTLLKAIYDLNIVKYAKVTGIINKRNNHLGYLEQVINDNDLIKSVKEYLFVDEIDYYNKINKLYKLLLELNLKEELLEVKEIKTLSGGEKVKVQLLKILLNDPDILLLDEPTNDLDITTLKWLENFINRETKPIIYVSHDEILLSKTANVILHLELIKKKTTPKSTVMRTNYNDYIEKRFNLINKKTQVAKKERQEYQKKEAKLNQIMNKVEYQLNTISRSDPHGAKLLKKKMKSVKVQEKRLENTELTEIPDYEEAINFFFEKTYIPSKKEIIKLDLKELKINNKILVNNIHLEIRGNEHIVIIGDNGIGKTTLIKEIHKLLKDRSDIILGFMPQNYDEILNNFKTPIDYLAVTKDKDEISLIRSYMGNIHFTREEMTGEMNNLSGGSKAKLILLKLILSKCNVLLLDEPTRNVSPLSNPIIRKILTDFDGAIISVSHDRKYIEEVCNKVYELKPDGLIEIRWEII